MYSFSEIIDKRNQQLEETLIMAVPETVVIKDLEGKPIEYSLREGVRGLIALIKRQSKELEELRANNRNTTTLENRVRSLENAYMSNSHS